MKDKVCIVGSGNWGSAIATIIGPNVIQHSSIFEPIVHMWVYEEMVPLPQSLIEKDYRSSGSNNQKAHLQVTNHQSSSSSITPSTTTKYKLTDIINTYHENVKYLPNIRLPTNIVATSDLTIACNNATLLIFVVPHQFLSNILRQICQSKTININNCRAISLIKGLDFDHTTQRPKLISHIIQQEIQKIIPNYQFPCGVLMGANIATEVAQQQQVCESTLACQFDTNDHIGTTTSHNSINYNERTRLLFHNHNYFRVQHSVDVIGTEICGAIKNCIALGAGYVDGLQYGSNTKAALLRVGLYEIYQFATFFYPNDNIQFNTMMESCGIADLITTCYSGRNRLCAETFAKEQIQIQKHENIHHHTTAKYNACRKHWEDIELRLLNGQKIQGVNTVDEVYQILKAHTVTEYFPLLTTIYNITFGHQPIQKIVDGIQIKSNPNNNKQNITNMTKLNNQRARL